MASADPKIIFTNGKVIDLDFSKWDRYVRIVVAAWAYPASDDGRSKLFNVDFCDISEFHWKSFHLGVKVDPPNDHCQWNAMEYHDDTNEDGSHKIIISSGGPPGPLLTIGCRSVQVSSLDWNTVLRLNPNAVRFGGPLSRPSFDDEINGEDHSESTE